ncbi:hypothetical protein Hypma_002818 [Hypsizygus marmoreus]|uniref:MARVEL domain-containing protein n=1 Tax=Hypsizygus marmoreus TaxID=39966 RepID=A0A369JC71_HYPMA|nr:hypothetical protein Hypma_002818 [Hypsizygus marmoreus]
MSSPAAPLKTARLATLALCWAWAIVLSGLGLNALVEANRSKSGIKKKVPAPTVVTIDDSDALTSGIVLTTGSVLTAVLASNFFLMMLFPPMKALATRTLKLQAFAFIFCITWLVACAVPFTYFYNTRHAIVRAFVGGVELPHTVIEALEKKSGSTSVYKELDYLRWLAIISWITILFTIIATAVLFKASSQATKISPTIVPGVSQYEEKEKGSDERLEKAPNV